MELSLVFWVLVLMMAGAAQVGLLFVRAIQAGEVCRNANVLTVRGVDLSQSINQQLLVRTGPTLGLKQAGNWNPDPSGDAVVYVTQVLLVGDLECSSGVANYDGTTATCPNLGSYVITRRIVIGNASRGSSTVGNPASPLRADGTITDANICTNTGNRATGFPSLVTLSADSYTLVAELYADSSKFNLFSFLGAPTIYMRNLS